MKLVSWNVNGVRAAWKKGFGQWIEGEKADVVCLQETTAQPDQLTPEILNPHGYHGEWHWGEKKGYSGVASFSMSAPVSVERGFAIMEFDIEGRGLVT